MIILGIDPGIATLGYGVIEKEERGGFRAIDCGVVVTPKEEGLPVRLAMLEEEIKKVLDKYRPDEVAMEELFFSKNITTGIAVAQARGVALLTCVKACGRLYEYTPMQIKQALTGYGKADKKQIQTVVTSLLRLKEIPKPDDAADALAIALCHGFCGRFGELYAVGNMTRAKGQNATPASAYQALMQAAERKRGRKKETFSSAQEMNGLQQATGIGRATQAAPLVNAEQGGEKSSAKQGTKKMNATKTSGVCTGRTAFDIAASVVNGMKTE